MDQDDEFRLKKLHLKLIKDVRVSYVLPYLMEVLTEDDRETINNERTERLKTDKLLTILPHRGPRAFGCFLEALAENYDWIHKELKSINPDEHRKPPEQNEKRLQEINDDMIDILRDNSHLVRNWRILAHRLGMSPSCSNIQIQANIYLWDLGQCFLNLMEKWHADQGQKATIGKLIDALRQERFNDAADKLEERFM